MLNIVLAIKSFFLALGKTKGVAILRALFVANPTQLVLNQLLTKISPQLSQMLFNYFNISQAGKPVKLTPLAFKKPMIFWGRHFKVNKTLLSGLTQPQQQFLFNQSNQLIGKLVAEAVKRVTGKTIEELTNGKVKHFDLRSVYRFINNLTQKTRRAIGRYVLRALLNGQVVKVLSSWLQAVIFTYLDKDDKFGFLLFKTKKYPNWYGGGNAVGYPMVRTDTFLKMRGEANAGTTWWRDYFRSYLNILRRERDKVLKEREIRTRRLKSYLLAMERTEQQHLRQQRALDYAEQQAEMKQRRIEQKQFKMQKETIIQDLKRQQREKERIRLEQVRQERRAKRKKAYNLAHIRKKRILKALGTNKARFYRDQQLSRLPQSKLRGAKYLKKKKSLL